MRATPLIQETLLVHPLAPFRLDFTVWALRRRASNAIDRWDGTTYTRILVIDHCPVKVSISQRQHAPLPELLVTVESPALIDKQVISTIRGALQRLLGLQIDVTGFYTLAKNDPFLSPLAQRFLGLQPPRFPGIFEALLNAFACQQVSLEVGLMLLNRLTATYGMKFDGDHPVHCAFPEPQSLAGASVEDVKRLGFSRQKARAIIELATTLVSGQRDLSLLDSMTNEEVKAALSPIRGVGRWSAEYVLLRGLGRLDTFPGDDVGAQKNLQRLLQLAEKPLYETVREVTSSWQPYAGFVYFHLLLEKLYQQGLLSL
jgi:DNA-3-methyladenine glycosylase II